MSQADQHAVATSPDSSGERRVLKGLLIALILAAGALLTLDLIPSAPGLLDPSQAPTLDLPTRPGDQTRRYEPEEPWRRGPGTSLDMPRRLTTAPVERENGQSGLQLRGVIAPGDAQGIAEIIARNAPDFVLLDSPGGSVNDALELGRLLRGLGTETQLAENSVCFSACPYVFVGGVIRSVHDSAQLGVHQHSFGKSQFLPAFLAVEDVQRGQAQVLAHLTDMGVNLGIMGPAMATPADEIYILSQNELTDWQVVTE